MRDIEKTSSPSLLIKVLGLAVVAIFLLIGIIGLVLPIIPGIVFLFLAALVLAKISTRFDGFFRRLSAYRKMRKFRRSVTRLSIAERLKLSFWVMARGTINLVESGVQLFRKAWS